MPASPHLLLPGRPSDWVKKLGFIGRLKAGRSRSTISLDEGYCQISRGGCFLRRVQCGGLIGVWASPRLFAAGKGRRETEEESVVGFIFPGLQTFSGSSWSTGTPTIVKSSLATFLKSLTIAIIIIIIIIIIKIIISHFDNVISCCACLYKKRWKMTGRRTGIFQIVNHLQPPTCATPSCCSCSYNPLEIRY